MSAEPITGPFDTSNLPAISPDESPDGLPMSMRMGHFTRVLQAYLQVLRELAELQEAGLYIHIAASPARFDGRLFVDCQCYGCLPPAFWLLVRMVPRNEEETKTIEEWVNHKKLVGSIMIRFETASIAASSSAGDTFRKNPDATVLHLDHTFRVINYQVFSNT